MSKKKIIIICGLIFLIAVAVVALIFSTEPTAKSEGATKKSAMLVSVEPIEKGTFSPTFTATGTVRAYEDIRLNALVSGQIIKRNPAFVPGGLVKKGEELLKINPEDFRNQLELQKSELLQAQSDLEVEMGRQNVARQDLTLVGGDTLNQQQKNLILREPQLNAIKARLKATKASVNQAELNIKRTSVTAPFDAQIISQNVSLGSQVSPGDNLGRIVGIEEYWVEVNLPVKKLKWLSFPKNTEEKGAEVSIKSASNWEEDEKITGYLAQQVGALDRQSRLARVLIKIPDPLGYKAENKDKPKLIIGGFIQAELKGKPIGNVLKLKRDYLRTNNTVWVMQNGKLSIRKVKVKLIDANYAYLTEGLEDGELVVTSDISTVTNDIPLRTENDSIRQ